MQYLTIAWTTVKMVTVKYLPRKESARNPPRRQSMNEVPMKLVTVLAETELLMCMTPVSLYSFPQPPHRLGVPQPQSSASAYHAAVAIHLSHYYCCLAVPVRHRLQAQVASLASSQRWLWSAPR
ncbi:hypothetical protein AKJ16_DCAP02363 [Drosera capensis]